MRSRRRSTDTSFDLFELEAPSGNRLPRLEHLFFEEVDRLFRLEVSNPRLQSLSIVSLHLSPDLRNAKISYALSATRVLEKDIRMALDKVVPFLRARLSEALSMKRIPALHFHRDRLAEASLRAGDVLSTIHSSQPNKESQPSSNEE